MRIKLYPLLIAIFFILFLGCKEDEIVRSYPRVQTNNVIDVSSQGATLKGGIISSNFDSVSAVGFVWSESNNPTVSNSEVVYLDPSVIDDGNFHFILRTTLDDDKRYWVRAFATQGELRVFGDTTSFTSLGSFSNPVITDFEPKSGTDLTEVSISGEGFSHKSEENKVTFGGVVAQVIESSTDELKVLAPVGINTRESILKVVVTGNEYEAEEKFIRNAPIIDSFTPLASACGTSVTIIGSNFSTIASGNEVYFGDSPAVITSFLSDELIVTTPSDLTADPVKISVKTAGQTSISGENFIPNSPTVGSFSPTSGTDNDLITISGTNFGSAAEGVVVMIDGLVANINSVNSTEIVVEVPAGISASEVELSVKVGCAAEFVSPVLFNRLAPVISDFNPKSATACRETITISGSNFGTTIGSNKVFFDDMQVAILSASSSELEVSPFQIANGTYDLSVEVAGQKVKATNQINLIYSELCDESLIAYYPFNGNANDESNNNNNGSVQGATLTTDRNGNPNSAYDFDGINDYISLGTSSVFSLGSYSEFTVSFWVKPDNVTSPNETIFSKYVSAGNNRFYQFGYRNPNNISFVFWEGGGNINAQINEYPINTNWQHITWRFDNGLISLFIDGVLVSNTSADFNIKTPNSNGVEAVIGALNFSSVEYDVPFDGKIDELRVYNRALSNSEIGLISQN